MRKYLPRKKDLRQFGVVVGCITMLLFAAIPYIRSHKLNVWLSIIGLLIFITGVVGPALLRPLYTIWMRIGSVLSWINTRVILSLFYYLILCPIGLARRLIKNDPLKLRFESLLETYRIESKELQVKNMEVPF